MSHESGHELGPQACLAVIPARGGSKGVPRKNVRSLAGLPLVAHAILAARGSASITRVVVSTDDAEIAAVSKRYGAEIIERPAALSGDTSSSESALVHALDTLRAREGYVPELVMLIQCTSPLTISSDLDGLLATLSASQADSAFIAVPFHHFLWRSDAEGRARGVNHSGANRQRRQDLEPQFLESGAAYAMRTAAFLESGDRFCGRVVMHVSEAERCLEIDDPIDFDKADAVLSTRRRDNVAALLPARVDALIMDFDGVLTDNRVWVDEQGREAVTCDRGDGFGLGLLRQRGIRMLILSKEKNPVVRARADKLRIECLHGIDDKESALRAWLEREGVDAESAVYVGNDLNDLACMRLVGCAVAPPDAHRSALSAARIVLSRPGGQGAVRELCDAVLARLGDSDDAI